MIEDETHMVQRAKAERSRCWLGGLALAAVGAAGLIGGSGFALLTGSEGDRATVAGVAAGMGLAFMLLGGLMAWWGRPGRPVDVAASRDGSRREKLQRERTRQLVLFPLVLLMFMAQAQGGPPSDASPVGDHPSRPASRSSQAKRRPAEAPPRAST